MSLETVVAPGEGEGFATDLIAGAHHPISKIAHGPAGTATLASESDPFPISDAAAVAQLAAILAKIISGKTGLTLGTDTYMPVAPIPVASKRIGFDKVISGGVDTDFITIISQGTGQTVNQANGSLVLTSGTTANAETIIRSVDSFKGNIVARWSALLTQRIVQNNFYIELVDVIGDALAFTINSAVSVSVTIPDNPFTSQNVGQSMWLGAISGAAGIPNRWAIASVAGNVVTFTVSGWPASGSGTLSLFGWNYHQIIYQSTTATAVDFDAQRNGWASGVTPAAINTTASTHVGTYTGGDGEVSFSDQTGATATGIELVTRGSRVRNVPLNETELRAQIRMRNGTSNPATGTTFTVGFVDVSNCSPMPVAIYQVAPMSKNSGLPCTLEASIIQNVLIASINAGTSLFGDVGQQYRASATGAASRAHLVSAATTNATVAKASAGRLLGVQLINTTAAPVYLKFHNASATPTAGAAVFMTVGVPANGRADIAFEGGIAFSTGIAYTVVTGAADADATAPLAANSIVGDVIYA